MAGHASLTCDEFLDLAAGVALDAGEPGDIRVVEEHAGACPECRARLDQFRSTAAALGAIVPQTDPPPVVRERLFDAVRREPKPFAAVRRLWPRAGRRPKLSAAWLVAAASLVLAVASLAWVAVLQLQISDLRTQTLVASERAGRFDRVTSVLASDQLAVKPLQPAVATVASSGYVFLDPISGTGMLMCHDLPPVPQGHAYQVWFVRGNDRVSGGMLWPDPRGDGYAMIRVPADLQSFESIGLTDEPGSGSAWPTTPKVIGTPLKESTQ
jgi:predicted anti-sigma-YlaC factor YlaD